MMKTYFTFEIDGERVGYYAESDHEGVLAAVAWIQMEGQWFENAFWIRHEQGRVLSYRFTGSDWQAFEEEADVFPTSAFPLLLRRVLNEKSITYRQFIEGEHAVGREAVLTLEGNRVVETVGGQPGRSAVFAEGEVVQYGWGGTAVSHRCASREDALRGLALPDDWSEE